MMINDLKRSCHNNIQTVLFKLESLSQLCLSSCSKQIQLKIQSIVKDAQLLKDNFTILATGLGRLEMRHIQKAHSAAMEQQNRLHFQQIQESYKILEAKYQKRTKELNFMKFSNKILRQQMQTEQKDYHFEKRLQKATKKIEELLIVNAASLNKKIIQVLQIGNFPLPEFEFKGNKQIEATHGYQTIKLNKQNYNIVEEVTEFSAESPDGKLCKQQFTSCELKTQRLYLKTKRKQVEKLSHTNQGVSTGKKQLELAKLVEKQSRLSKVHERYLSTDI